MGWFEMLGDRWRAGRRSSLSEQLDKTREASVFSKYNLQNL